MENQCKGTLQQKWTPTHKHGYGIQYFKDGSHYEGQWSYNKAEGQGTLWHAEGDVYKGEFKNDMANGYGEYSHINGSKYKGEFRDLLRRTLFLNIGFLVPELNLQMGLFLCWRYGSSFSGGLFIDFAFPIFLQRTSFLFCLSYSDVQKCKPDVFFSEILDSQNFVNLLF